MLAEQNHANARTVRSGRFSALNGAEPPEPVFSGFGLSGVDFNRRLLYASYLVTNGR
jgi:hypothetical protein